MVIRLTGSELIIFRAEGASYQPGYFASTPAKLNCGSSRPGMILNLNRYWFLIFIGALYFPSRWARMSRCLPWPITEQFYIELIGVMQVLKYYSWVTPKGFQQNYFSNVCRNTEFDRPSKPHHQFKNNPNHAPLCARGSFNFPCRNQLIHWLELVN